MYLLDMTSTSSLGDQAAGIGSLAEPVRRALYLFVSRQPVAVSREEAARGVGVPTHTAKFHLDKLVDGGLLDTEYRRLTGRSGPGAGRPTKLYRRSERDFDVSLPERNYDLLGHILAEAVETSLEQRTDVGEAAAHVARREGLRAGATSESDGDPLERTASTLEVHGFEPRVAGDRLLLDNCPFDRLAQEHTELVCGLNLEYVRGIIEGLQCTGLTASLQPNKGRCCVVARIAT